MSTLDSQNLQEIHDLLLALFDPTGFYQGFLIGLTFAGGFLIAHMIRDVWSDRED
jgi:hypothetical protein